ncbi:hypothetical protein BZG36_02546 [Bifiguratus adelaidae]|uniref:Protein AF-9 homolog n=1 Tax=Bifiguratus adelaidae TaxID=1938954 RepID=A0A261Y266_9FUNG|nr:hypothetical protein BZG36_02546 [Bifiguratus adelaidae]
MAKAPNHDSVAVKYVKILTEQRINPDKPPDAESQDNYWRRWKLWIRPCNEKGRLINEKSTYIDHVAYQLHPSFGDRASQVIKKEPYEIAEEGWGEFDMRITFHFKKRFYEPQAVNFDLHFRKENYETTIPLTFVNPKPEFLALLQFTPVRPKTGGKTASKSVGGKTTPGAGKTTAKKTRAPARPGRRGSAASVKTAAQNKSKSERKMTNDEVQADGGIAEEEAISYVDIDEMAQRMRSLDTQALLQLRHVIDEYKDDITTKDEAREGEDSTWIMDLGSFPEGLLIKVWDFVSKDPALATEWTSAQVEPVKEHGREEEADESEVNSSSDDDW